MDLRTALGNATGEFGRRLALVGQGRLGQDDWARPTPCTEWDVHYLTAHVVGGNRFAVMILGGMSSGDAIEQVMSQSQLGDDPFGSWAITSGAQLAAFEPDDALELLVDHPIGTMTGRRFLELRVFDLTLHAWDLARAIDADEQLAADLVDTVLDLVEHGAVGRGLTHPDTDKPDATPQERLLALTGRSIRSGGTTL